MRNEGRTRGVSRCGIWVLAIVLAGGAAIPVLAAVPARRGTGAMRGRGGARGMLMPNGARAMPAPGTSFSLDLQNWNQWYRRSLLGTSKGAPERVPQSLAKSREAWYSFLGYWYATPPPEYAEDAHWQADLAAITGHIHLAEWLATSGDMHAAHETLESVRQIWMGIRTRNRVRWFGDEITRYHDVMEPVVLWGTGQVRGGVTEDNLEEFAAEVAVLVEAWRDLAQFRFRPKAPMGRGGQLQFTIFMSQANEAINRLHRVVEDGWIEDIPEAAREVKATFVPLFMNFG